MIAIKFNCKPQTFLRSGDQKLTFTGTGTIFNPTMFTAKPLLRIFGKGTVDIGDESITVLSNDSYTDVDCESEEAYMDDAASPRNNLVRVSGDDFPVLPPGQTHIRLSGGIQKLEVIPRWWKL
jgi:phage-related protein